MSTIRNGWLETRDSRDGRISVRIAAIECIREITEGEEGVELQLTTGRYDVAEYYHELVEAVELPKNQVEGQ